ncbi:MAG: methionine--tRNA ligase [Candidatus Moranbacteria bacterium RBG_19FT_COMBO_42_6]|nr:MAG: methionine--tRNA ligase [Candidatus Moranbacteria bacterium RBG_19FT_COMBO_42_6]
MSARGGSASGGKKRFYITTTLPYVNAEPHIGFSLEIIEADVQARFQRQLGNKVYFNTGTDEHGLKIFRKAEELGIPTQKYCDNQAGIFFDLKRILNLSFDNFIRTTDDHHMIAARKFWDICQKNGDIYKKIYKVKYCVGCELEKTESDLVDGKCPLHPNLILEIIKEENYFFRFSKFQNPLLELYRKNPDFVVPNFRFNEIKAFVERGLEDFSISRLKSKMPWGIEVPGDPEHVIYVWFDALINYVSAAGWPSAMKKFNSWWPVVQLAGKDNLRQQSAMWQAMLMSAKIKPSKQIFINGFINVDGQKMSKSLGNVISPYEMVEKFGTDGTRYLLLSFGNYGEDMDVSWKKFTEKYNADLANGLGNLVSRVVKLKTEFDYKKMGKISINPEFTKLINSMELGRALEYIWDKIREDNKFIEDNKPWELAKSDIGKFGNVMWKLFVDLNFIAEHLFPFMPETAEKIKNAFKTKKVPMLFPRIK